VDEVELAGFPAPFTWEVEPSAWSVRNGSLTVEAAGRTDLFVHPEDGMETLSAPRLLARVQGDFTLSARVTVEFESDFDAGVLVLWSGSRSWAKLCFELSPQREPMVVSVVTRGVSDDCNSFVVDARDVGLRIARLGAAFAFHASTDGARWQLVRHFALGAEDDPRVGFLAQSPLGSGCAVRFDQIAFAPGRLADIRSGS
jgi:uncharacterized protein